MPKIRAKKSLGQHFLTSASVAQEAAEALALSHLDTAVEVGPGTGILTRALLDTGARVIAVEKDERALPVLRERFEREVREGRLVIEHGDILEFDPDAYGLGSAYALAGNIPYYITGAIVRKFTDAELPPAKILFMVQKEVAERMLGRDGWSLLTVAVHSFGHPRIVKKVGARFFKPKPKVDSAIILIERSGSLQKEKREKILDVARVGFAHKRKRLAGNLSAAWKKEDIQKAFAAAGTGENARAEELSLAEWAALAAAL